MQLKGSNPEDFKGDGECLDADESLELVQNQTLGKSTIPSTVFLYVHEFDILNFNTGDLEKSFFTRMLSHFESLDSMQHEIAEKESQVN